MELPQARFHCGCKLPDFAISMLQASHRAVVRGPAFVRQLARLIHADVPPPESSLSDRLSQWLDWKHALALSGALDGHSSAVASDVAGVQVTSQDDCARSRSSQVEAIAADAAMDVTVPSRGRKLPLNEHGNEVIDYAVFRQRYLARQRAMQSVTGDLRGRLRDRLAAQSVTMARLAEVDAAMELALSPREQTLLAKVPVVLASHFENLHQAALASGSTASSMWLTVFRQDMRGVLLAELDLRFQPVEALLAALRTC